MLSLVVFIASKEIYFPTTNKLLKARKKITTYEKNYNL